MMLACHKNQLKPKSSMLQLAWSFTTQRSVPATAALPPVGQEGFRVGQIIKGGTAAALPLKVIKEVFKEGVARPTKFITHGFFGEFY